MNKTASGTSNPQQQQNPDEEIRAEESTKDGFPIVGIGASAGGLEAFQEMLSGLPADTGMAFVLVMHLDPHHESLLVEVLHNRTAMPVEQIEDKTVVQPNRIYAIPPNVTVDLSGHTLLLMPRRSKIPHNPIDAFFTSLAREMGANAIGVILSGTASDGTIGLKAIKAAAGITFCQDESAKFDGMPRTAIATGVVTTFSLRNESRPRLPRSRGILFTPGGSNSRNSRTGR